MFSGLISFFYLGQDEDPPFTFRAMVIKVDWPGATPLQMAKQISEPIETKLKTISSRAKITSFSREGETTIENDEELEGHPGMSFGLAYRRHYGFHNRMLDMAQSTYY